MPPARGQERAAARRGQTLVARRYAAGALSAASIWAIHAFAAGRGARPPADGPVPPSEPARSGR
jgi:hypothetical protein